MAKRIELSELACELAIQSGDYKQAIIHQYYVGIVKFWQGDLENAINAATNCKGLMTNFDDSISKRLRTS